jgi:hypothetical protein
LIDGKAPGALPLLSAEQRQALHRVVETGPISASHGTVRWRLIDLAQWIWGEFGLSTSKQTLSRELRGSDYQKLSVRPRQLYPECRCHPRFKKDSPQLTEIRATLPRGMPLEIWWQDKACVGLKNGITRRSARRGTRPSAPKVQRTKSAHIYGAICQTKAKRQRLVLPLQH